MRQARWCGLASVAAFLFLPFGQGYAQSALGYQKPPEPIERLFVAPVTPVVEASPDRKTLLVMQPASFPSIEDLARPRFRLAGLRFDPTTNGPSRQNYAIRLALQPLEGGPERPVTGLPAKVKVSHAAEAIWSPNSQYVALIQRTDATAAAVAKTPGPVKDAAAGGAGLELWVVEAATAQAHRVGTVRLSAVLGTPCAWMPDSTALVCKTVPGGRGTAPKPEDTPAGPNVEENLGKVTPGRTYEDLLKTPSDEAIFAYYATSQIAVVPLNGPLRALGEMGLMETVGVSPDGRFVLTSELHRPFTYSLPEEMFPERTEVLPVEGGAATVLFDRPLVDDLPIAFDAVPKGPRAYQWRADVPATLTWIEAADGGDPKKDVPVHDRLRALAAPFTGEPLTLLESPMRLRAAAEGSEISWGNAHLAVATEARWSDRHLAIVAFDPSSATTAGAAKPTLLYEGSSQDLYQSPGEPVMMVNATGHEVLQLTPDGSGIYFIGPGASPRGDRPFVATIPVAGGAKTILFQSQDPTYTQPVTLLDEGRVLVRQESATVAPNYFAAPLHGGGTPTAITHFASPYAGIPLPTRQLLHYKRADGVELTATLWLPAGYNKAQGPLPTLMEAYPAEFKTRSAAGQVSGSENRFPRINWASPAFFTAIGYAVLQNASIPIIGEGNAQPNDTYVQQLVDGAKAAIDYGASLGVVDPKRVAVMGHSYGAFMTANLLAHSALFRAGIARSGAYNRTLTPYGFQAEERTYWQAPEVYYKMSPFSYADKIKTPILLIHGEADDNQGTFPIQSERFYAALKGQGATVRLVYLPLEAHAYAARESLEHMLWEMSRWMDTYVKPATPVGSPTTAVGSGQ